MTKHYLKIKTNPSDLNALIYINDIPTNNLFIEEKRKVNIKVSLAGYQDYESNFSMPSKDSVVEVKLNKINKDIKNKDLVITPTDSVQNFSIPFGYTGYGNVLCEASSGSSEVINVHNYSGYPVTEGENVFITRWWDGEAQESKFGIKTRGFSEINEDSITGVALADAQINEDVDVKVVEGEFYYANLIFDTVPPTAVPYTSYFNRYEGGNWNMTSDLLEVPYYTNVTGVVKAEGYKPYTINETVQNEDVELHIELEPSTPL